MPEQRKTVIGVDPGETTGIVRLEYQRYWFPNQNTPDARWTRTGEPMAIQCNHQSVPEILAWLTAIGDILISHERFVVGLRASRSKKAGASQVTRDINGHIDALDSTNTPNRRIRVVEHTASEVKPWATDERLKAAGIDLAPEMRHARDGGRQALFAACHDLGATDPLSKRARLAAAYSGGGVHPVTLPPNTVEDGKPLRLTAAGTLVGPNYGVRVTHVGGEPVTDAVITFDPAGEPLCFPDGGTTPPHEVMRRVIDSQAAEQARYIGIERQIEEWNK